MRAKHSNSCINALVLALIGLLVFSKSQLQQLIRVALLLACHAGGQQFESAWLHPNNKKQSLRLFWRPEKAAFLMRKDLVVRLATAVSSGV